MPRGTECLRPSIKEPIPQIFAAWELLNQAADAHLAGDTGRAAALFREANTPAVWNWTNPHWEKTHLNVRFEKPTNDTREVPPQNRDPLQAPSKAVKAAALARDGYRCRYCGIPVIHADIRKWAQEHYPSSVPWHPYDGAVQHAAFQCMWLQFDHVIPHSHGGPSSLDNIVVTCALCNFGKWDYTLAQLGLIDPRTRPPEPVAWDGLERLRVPRTKKRNTAAKPR